MSSKTEIGAAGVKVLPSRTYALREPQSIGEFQLEKIIGRGSTGTIFLGSSAQGEMSTPAAVKVFHVFGEGIDPQREMILHRYVSEPQSPHIIQFLADGIGQINDRRYTRRFPFLVTEFAEGGNLRTVLMNQGKIPVENAIDVTEQTASGLTIVHLSGLAHGDVKPENVLLASQSNLQRTVPRVKVADFGAARFMREGKSPYIDLSAGYTPPEQLFGYYLPEGDQFSLAAVFAEMVGGESLLPRKDKIVYWNSLTAPTYLEDVSESIKRTVPEPFQNTIRTALSWEPEDRFESAATFVMNLRNNYANATEEQLKTPVTVIDLANRPVLLGVGGN